MNATKKTFLVIGGIFALAGIMRAAEVSEQEKTEPQQQLTNADKLAVCKAYIGSMFLKPTKIIKLDKDIENRNADHVYVYYKRPSDGTYWQYVCNFQRDRLNWAGYQRAYPDEGLEGYWGRWRDEDTVTLNVNPEANAVSFPQPDTGKLITVQL